VGSQDYLPSSPWSHQVLALVSLILCGRITWPWKTGEFRSCWVGAKSRISCGDCWSSWGGRNSHFHHNCFNYRWRRIVSSHKSDLLLVKVEAVAAIIEAAEVDTILIHHNCYNHRCRCGSVTVKWFAALFFLCQRSLIAKIIYAMV